MPVNAVLISPYDKQSLQTKCWLLQDCAMDITATEDTYLQVKISVSQHTQTVCVCGCAVYIPPARELQPGGKTSRPPQSGVYQNPLDRAYTPTHTHQTGCLNNFFWPCSQSSNKHTRQSCNLRQTHTNSLFVSNPHIHTRSHTTSLSWSSEG